uniref:LAGLIDADG endonuclease n=1 Tax=Elmerina hispida TaxID=1245649 RepID=UPI003001D695|nr:LAGLIDADG endonuclease [Elmerina hispida]
MLNYVRSRLKVGKVTEREHFSTYTVTSSEILRIIEIFDRYPLNTSKHLNYLAFKEGYLLYSNKDIKKGLNTILALKGSMNKKRVYFELPSNHTINITSY